MTRKSDEIISLPLAVSDEVFHWCSKNIGKWGDRWVWASNAHNTLFIFKKAEDATLFALKWK